MLKQTHTNEVKDYLDEREPNKVIHKKPPEISTKKTLLSKRTLAELRSGYSPYLNSNAKRISTVDYDCCPNCIIEAHTTRHLFNCKNIAGRLPDNSCNRFVDRQSKKTAKKDRPKKLFFSLKAASFHWRLICYILIKNLYKLLLPLLADLK